ncbi:YihY/virulence factor BrkB family protein [Paracoccus jiaweipingae]|uniref:YihY/virulence factor BrkB family protein n=1 Tax=unclassified Paracoccus (in: a-proteobacteria) TaxID=2688777 RepID=UPI0037AF060A
MAERGIWQALTGDLDDATRRRAGLLPPPPDPRSKAQRRHDTIIAAPGPDTPWQLSAKSWLAVARRAWSEIGRDRVTSVAAGVTFYALLSLFPAITALVSIYALLADPNTIQQHLSTLSAFLPEGAMGIISDQVGAIAQSPRNALSAAGAVAILLALYSTMGGTKALLDALNMAWFQTEKRGFIRLNLVAFLFTIGAIGAVIAMLAIVAVIPALLAWLPLGPLADAALQYLRWPVMFGGLLLGLAVLYRWGPSRDDAAWHWISPGALLASVGLVAASLLFSWYAANFANYNETYGSLGAVIGLMMWLWIAAMVVMVGAELNAAVERQILLENGLPDTQDTPPDSPQ